MGIGWMNDRWECGLIDEKMNDKMHVSEIKQPVCSRAFTNFQKIFMYLCLVTLILMVCYCSGYVRCQFIISAFIVVGLLTFCCIIYSKNLEQTCDISTKLANYSVPNYDPPPYEPTDSSRDKPREPEQMFVLVKDWIGVNLWIWLDVTSTRQSGVSGVWLWF